MYYWPNLAMYSLSWRLSKLTDCIPLKEHRGKAERKQQCRRHDHEVKELHPFRSNVDTGNYHRGHAHHLFVSGMHGAHAHTFQSVRGVKHKSKAFLRTLLLQCGDILQWQRQYTPLFVNFVISRL